MLDICCFFLCLPDLSNKFDDVRWAFRYFASVWWVLLAVLIFELRSVAIGHGEMKPCHGKNKNSNNNKNSTKYLNSKIDQPVKSL